MPSDWKARAYGRLTGAQIEQLLGAFGETWNDRASLFGKPEGDVQAAIVKLASFPNWVSYYQCSLIELIAQIAVASGLKDKILEAARSADPAAVMIDAFNLLPDEAPNAEALAMSLAMVGNLDAIARYSRSINDMLRACREENDGEALLQALSVDSQLISLPGVLATMRLGQLVGDASAAGVFLRAIRGPHGKRLAFPELRWAEYLLRDQGAFQACTREEIYELIVVHLRLYDPAGRKKDPKAALFTLFRTWQKEAGIQNPRFGFSVNPK